MSEYMLEIKNLTKKYESFTLDNVGFDLPKGSVMGLIGQNGAGKTTVIKLIMNTIAKNSGTILVDTMDNIEKEVEVKNIIGYVSDEDYLFTNCNLKQHSQAFKEMFDSWDQEYFEKLAEKWELSMSKKVNTFSKGMKTKAMVALTLAHRPQVLILDEPTAGLDPVARIELLDMLREFVSDGEKSVLFSTHITSDLDKIADYITILIKGKVTESISVDKVEEKFAVISSSPDIFEGKESYTVGIKKGSVMTEALVKRENLSYFGDVSVHTPNIENLLTFSIWGNGYERN